jgi:hypothetical protein
VVRFHGAQENRDSLMADAVLFTGVALELGQDERGEMNAGIGEKLDDEVVQMNRGAVYQSIVRRKVDGSLQLDIALKMNDRIQT